MKHDVILTFNPDGTAEGIYSDHVPFSDLCPASGFTAERVSNIEFNPATQRWEVCWAGDTNAVYSDVSRDACVTWEHSVINSRRLAA